MVLVALVVPKLTVLLLAQKRLVLLWVLPTSRVEAKKLLLYTLFPPVLVVVPAALVVPKLAVPLLAQKLTLLMWVMAAASASAAWSLLGASVMPRSNLTKVWTAFLSAAAVPETACLMALGV